MNRAKNPEKTLITGSRIISPTYPRGTPQVATIAAKYPRLISAIVRRSPSRRATRAATKLPAIEASITRMNARLTSRRRSSADQAASSGRLPRCSVNQNMKAQCAVSELDQIRMTRMEVLRDPGRNRSAIAGGRAPADEAASAHSAGSGTSRRIPKTSQAGSTPTRNTSRGLTPAISSAATAASKMPTFTADWSTAASQGRHRRGQVPESSEAPIAHSRPIPSAARNRNINKCTYVRATADSPVKSA